MAISCIRDPTLPALLLCVFTCVGEQLFLERISKGVNLHGNKEQEGRHPGIFIIFQL